MFTVLLPLSSNTRGSSQTVVFPNLIGLYAVQFGNNWMKNFRGPNPIWLLEKFFHPIIYKLDKRVVLLLINHTVQISLQFFLLRNRGAALATRRRRSTRTYCFLMFLFTLWLLCHSSSSFCSTENLPLWLFWLVSLKFRENFGNFRETLAFFENGLQSAMRLSCHVTP